jgi:AcrR family transcriptional regulator
MTAREGESRSERKRRDILEAGRTLFLKEGYAGAGMEIIAREAAVSTATLYAHFPGKAELFQAVVEEAVAVLAVEAEAIRAETGDARARLLAFALSYGRFYCHPLTRAVFRLVTAERRRFGELADHFGSRSQTVLGSSAMAVIVQLREEGLLAVDKPASAAGQLLGMIEHPTLMFGLIRGDEAVPARPLEAVCEDAVDTFLARYAART